jgi:hypothetical protein
LQIFIFANISSLFYHKCRPHGLINVQIFFVVRHAQSKSLLSCAHVLVKQITAAALIQGLVLYTCTSLFPSLFLLAGTEKQTHHAARNWNCRQPSCVPCSSGLHRSALLNVHFKISSLNKDTHKCSSHLAHRA